MNDKYNSYDEMKIIHEMTLFQAAYILEVMS